MNKKDEKKARNCFIENNLSLGLRHFNSSAEKEEKHLQDLDRDVHLLKYLKENRFIENFEGLGLLLGCQYSMGQVNCLEEIKEYEKIGFEISKETQECLEELLESNGFEISEEILKKLPSDTYIIFERLYRFNKMNPIDNVNYILISECLANLIRNNIAEFEQEVGYSYEELKAWFSEEELDHMLLTHEIESTYTIDEFEKAGANFSNAPEEMIKQDKDGKIDRMYRYTYDQVIKMGVDVYNGIDISQLTKEPEKIDRKSKVKDMILQKTPFVEIDDLKSSEKYLNAIDKLNKAENNISLKGKRGLDFFPELFESVKEVINCIDMEMFNRAFKKDCVDMYNEKLNILDFNIEGFNWLKMPMDIFEWYTNAKISSFQEKFLVEFLKDIIVVMFPQKDVLNKDDLEKAFFMASLIRSSSFERETGTSIRSLIKSGLKTEEVEMLAIEYTGKRIDRKSVVEEKLGKRINISPDEFLTGTNNPEVMEEVLTARKTLKEIVRAKPNPEEVKSDFP